MRQKLRNLPSRNPDPRTGVIIVLRVLMSSAILLTSHKMGDASADDARMPPMPGLCCTVTEAGLEAIPFATICKVPALRQLKLSGSSSLRPPIVNPGCYGQLGNFIWPAIRVFHAKKPLAG